MRYSAYSYSYWNLENTRYLLLVQIRRNACRPRKKLTPERAMTPPQFSENEIEQNLKSRKSLALYRIQLLKTEGDCADDGFGSTDSDNGSGSYSESDKSTGFSSLFLPMLSHSIDDFLSLVTKGQTRILSDDDGGNQTVLSEVAETKRMARLLKIYRRISELDPTLNEEIGKQGAHLLLSRIIKLDMFSIDCCNSCHDDNDNDNDNEANRDTIIEIQDLAAEIASYSKSFPLRVSPFLREDMLARLPLVFNIYPVVARSQSQSGEHKTDGAGTTILINQVTERQSAQKDVGFVMWPSAVVLSRWLVSNPEEVRGKTVLELGSGCGLTGLVAAKIMKGFNNHWEGNCNSYEQEQSLSETESTEATTAATTTTTTMTMTTPPGSGSVILSDFNETVVKNLRGNIELNNLDAVATAEGIDFYQQDPNGHGWLTVDGFERKDIADLVIAADVICQPEDAFAAARTIASALRVGCKALVVSADSKHRFGVEKLEEACQTVGSLSVLSKTNVDDYYLQQSTSTSTSHSNSDSVSGDEDMEKTSGFVHGMTLTMYIILKTGEVTQ
uniref:FAM86 N-terminal domain-containing protein n=1 Tax=Pseudo-nitzschia australis TaxID=44445 RepID=A0A7S4APW1_9STRA